VVRDALAPLLYSGDGATPLQTWSDPVTTTDPVTGEELTLNTHVDRWFALAIGAHDFAETIAVQYWLNENGSRLQLDGVFGAATRAAVQTFQRAEGLVADGVVGPVTAVRLGITTP
jgi:peptidoglycan hydrolase-like protein with peptidoglycan-binding domain